MDNLDPATGQPLPLDSIQRILYITPKVHVYAVPPLTSNKGYTAAEWTTRPEIFTARLRIVETAIPTVPTKRGPTDFAKTVPFSHALTLFPEIQQMRVTITILFEDPGNGALFAAAPYTHPSVVSHCLDSSRFFAVRVVGDAGRKATLGIGFEERSDAFDFSITLQDGGKILGFETQEQTQARGRGAGRAKPTTEPKKDYSLKEGQTITVNIGGQGRRIKTSASKDDTLSGVDDAALFSIKPPPSAAEVRSQMQASSNASASTVATCQSAEELGFDDGEFGEFQ